MVRKVAARMRRVQLAAAAARWREVAEQGRTARALLSKAVARMTRLAVVPARYRPPGQPPRVEPLCPGSLSMT